MKGFKVSKNIKNIDDVSSTNYATYYLSGLLDSNKSESKVCDILPRLKRWGLPFVQKRTVGSRSIIPMY